MGLGSSSESCMDLSASPPLGSSSSGPRVAIDSGNPTLHWTSGTSSGPILVRSTDSRSLFGRRKSQRACCDFPGDLMRKEWRTYRDDRTVLSAHVVDAG